MRCLEEALAEVESVQRVRQGCVQVRAAEPQAVHRAGHGLGAQLEVLPNKHRLRSPPRHISAFLRRIICTHLKTLGLSFVPEAHNAVVGGATGYHVIPIRLDAVQRTVVRFLPLVNTLSVGDGLKRR